MTKEDKARKNKEWSKARKEALEVILSHLKEQDDLPENVKAAVSVYNKKRAVTGVKADFLTILRESKEIHEDDLFVKCKLGRVETRNIINSLIKVEPSERIWISFDRDTGIYKLENEGPEMPELWSGYIPADLVSKEDEEDSDYDLDDPEE